jgi:hypothetical protein
MRQIKYLLVVAFAAMLAACSGGQSGAGDRVSARDFVGLARHGIDIDYEPLASPADAVAKGDLIVEGTLVEIADGMTFGGANSEAAEGAGSYVTAVIEVRTVLDGTPVPGRRVYAMVPKSSVVGPRDLAPLGGGLRLVAVLDDIAGWAPAPGVTVLRPAAVPADAALYVPYSDGLWLQGTEDQQMVGLHAEPAELGPGWGQVRTLDGYVAALTAAAGR